MSKKSKFFTSFDEEDIEWLTPVSIDEIDLKNVKAIISEILKNVKVKIRTALPLLLLVTIFLMPLLYDIGEERYHVDESLHIGRGIKSIGLILHLVFQAKQYN